MRTLRTMASLALAAAISVPALAQQADSLSRDRLSASLDARFKLLDANGDGSFDKTEYLAARRKAEQAAAAMLKTMLSKEFAELDADKNGGVTAAEIDAKVNKPGTGKATVTRLDRNKDQKISVSEYSGQTGNISATANTDQQLKGWDKDSNGRITLQEYKGTALARFDSLDANKDGTLTAAEDMAAQKRQPSGR